MEIHEYLDLDPQTGAIRCNECDHHICDADKNYKRHCAMESGPLADIGPGFETPSDLLNADHDVRFRQFYCPSCAVLIDHEIARAEDPILMDIDINPASLKT